MTDDCKVPKCSKIKDLWDCVNKKVPQKLFFWTIGIIILLIGSLYTGMVLGKDRISDNKQDIAVLSKEYEKEKEQTRKEIEEINMKLMTAEQLSKVVKQAVKEAREDNRHE